MESAEWGGFSARLISASMFCGSGHRQNVTSCHRGAATGSPAASSHPIFRPLQDHAQGMLNRVEVAVGYEGWKLRILFQVQHLHVWLCSLSSSA